MNKQKRNTHRYREHFDDFQVGEGLGGWVKMVEGLRSTNWWLQSSKVQPREYSQQCCHNCVWSQKGARFIRMIPSKLHNV